MVEVQKGTKGRFEWGVKVGRGCWTDEGQLSAREFGGAAAGERGEANARVQVLFQLEVRKMLQQRWPWNEMVRLHERASERVLSCSW